MVREETLDTLKAQPPTVDAYDSLSKKIDMSFQWVFEKLDYRKPDLFLWSEARPSHARGGELWKPISEFKVWDETSDEDDIEFVIEFTVEDVFVDDEDDSEEEIDENNQVINMILGLQVISEQLLSKDKMKKWSSICSPSNLVDSFNQSREKAKVQLKIANNALQASQPITPSIPTPKNFFS